jgi:hypothetical protein
MLFVGKIAEGLNCICLKAVSRRTGSQLFYLWVSMRNTTKLKHLLQLYTIALEMNEEGEMQLMIFDKQDNSSAEFINKSYSVVVDKAYRYMMKRLPPKGNKTSE